jgi:lysophospholipase L1-like esterase
MKFGKLTLALVLLLVCSSAVQAEIAVKSGEKIAFMGDSITQAGAKPGGYCQLVIETLKKNGVETSGIWAGISGHKSNQMLARLEKDALSKKPTWMTLSCGVNDVWHGKNGVALEPYKKNMTEIVTRCQAAGIKVMILTSTMIRENQSGDLNQKLLPYNAVLRELAKEKKCVLVDLNADMQEALKKFPPTAKKGKQLTRDGVHMNALGNYMMAKGILKAFGLSDQQLADAQKDWVNIPNTVQVRWLQVGMSQAEATKLNALAAKKNTTLKKIMEAALKEKKEALLKE